MNRPVLLYVDDEQDNLSTFARVFRDEYEIVTAESGQSGLDLLRQKNPELIVADQRMPGLTGLDFLKQALDLAPDSIGMLLTAYTDLEVLIEAINSGTIYRYFAKPFAEEELRSAFRQALEHLRLKRENRRLLELLQKENEYLKTEVRSQRGSEKVIGAKSGLKEVFAKLQKVAPTDSTVLLSGESGTGKELIADEIHRRSPRGKKSIIKVNCAGLPETLLEAELFGYEKGAFTGATRTKAGRFELAEGGTIFLDEMGDISPKTQVSLLRVLQERQYERLGGSHTLKADVRVIAATNKNLPQLVEAGNFREDLFYRLNVFPIHLPPLRERKQDLQELVTHLIKKYSRRINKDVSSVDTRVIQAINDYPWPGNVRELENIIERAVILAEGPVLDQGTVSLGPATPASAASPNISADKQELTQEKLKDALKKAKGNKARAAKLLGIKRSTLYYHLQRLGLKGS